MLQHRVEHVFQPQPLLLHILERLVGDVDLMLLDLMDLAVERAIALDQLG